MTRQHTRPTPFPYALSGILFFLSITLGTLAAGEAQTAKTKPSEKGETIKPTANANDWTGKVVVVPVKGVMDWNQITGHSPILKGVRDAFSRMKKEPPRLVVVEVDSLGGSVLTCGLITEEIMGSKAPTVSLVLKEAISGGALVAVSCNEIEMVKGSRIGDVQPMSGSNPSMPMDERVEEKVESYVRAVMESHGEASEFPTRLLKAMVSRDIELYRVAFDDGTKEFLTKEEYELLKENIEEGIDTRKIADRELVVKEGDLLTLTPGKAVEYGLAKQVVDSREDFYAKRGIPMEDVIVADVPSGDSEPPTLKDLKRLKDIDWGLEPWKVVLLALLLTVGVAGVIAEAHMPGFGVPGTCGIIGLSAFFVVLTLEGHAEWYEILLCVVGIALLVTEIVLIPGFGVPGILGLTFLIGGLFLTFMPDFQSAPTTDIIWAEASHFVIMMMGTFVTLCLFGFLLVAYGHKVPVLKSFYHSTSLKTGAEVLSEASSTPTDMAEAEKKHNPNAELVGKTGVSTTYLRPAGKVRLDDGNLIDVVTQGDLIPAETKVKVIETRMNRIVVAPVNDEEATEA